MQINTNLKVNPKLLRRLVAAGEPDQETLREQRVSFAYGNLMGRSTKEQVRRTAGRIRLMETDQPTEGMR